MFWKDGVIEQCWANSRSAWHTVLQKNKTGLAEHKIKRTNDGYDTSLKAK